MTDCSPLNQGDHEASRNSPKTNQRDGRHLENHRPAKLPRHLEPHPDFQPGMRVVRGRDWKWGDQDGPGGEGTIFEILHGAVRVCWDHSGMINIYRTGCENNKFDVIKSPLSESLPPGLCVSDKRGGNRGVCEDSRFGWVTVRWTSDNQMQECRFGHSGAFDVRVVPSYWPLTDGNGLESGTRVTRARDWVWEMQDGGPGSLGTVERPAPITHWYCVVWDTGVRNIYRFSVSGKQDIAPHKLNSDGAPPEKVSLDEKASLQLARGSQVVRSGSWPYGPQDGGEGSRGTILGPSDRPGWIRVRWNKSGYQNDYRQGDIQVIMQLYKSVDKICVIPMVDGFDLFSDGTADPGGGDELCIACCNQSKGIMMRPCGHVTYCLECIQRVTQPISCPLCRQCVVHVERIETLPMLGDL